MLLLITPDNKKFYKEKMNDLFFARYRIFKQKLQWNLPCDQCQEIDNFDHDEAYYLLYLGYRGEVVGGMRMIPTTAPHMTRDVFFSCVYDPKSLPQTPDIFECSRFFIDTEAYTDYVHSQPYEPPLMKDPLDPKRVVGELLMALMEFGLSFRLSSIITVSEIRMERILRMLGWPLQRLGDSYDMGDSVAIVGMLDVSLERLQKLREKTGIDYPVLWGPLDQFTKASSSKF